MVKCVPSESDSLALSAVLMFPRSDNGQVVETPGARNHKEHVRQGRENI